MALEVATGNRVFTALQEQTKTAATQRHTLPKPFSDLESDLCKMLPFFLVNAEATEKEQHMAFLKSVPILVAKYKDFNAAIQAICSANIEVRTDQANAKYTQELFNEEFAKLERSLPVLEMEMPNFLKVDLFQEPREEIHRQLSEYLTGEVHLFVSRMVGALESMRTKRLIGKYEQSAKKETVCSYTFFRSVIVQEHVGDSENVNTRRVTKNRVIDEAANKWTETVEVWKHTTKNRHLQRVHRNARHEHHLYDANVHPWNIPSKPQRDWRRNIVGSHVPQPAFVQTLLVKLPSWLRDKYVKIVAGEMPYEKIIEVDTHVENWTEKKEEDVLIETIEITGNLYSPGVIIGDFVLSGWSGRDLK